MAVIDATTFLELLKYIQISSKTIVTPVPLGTPIINVDLDTRTIDVASSQYKSFLSIEKDHYAETLYFKVPRYFDGVDLMQTTIVMEYVNAKGESRVAPLLNRDVTTAPGYILLGWCIHGEATKAAGTLRFALHFYSIDLATNTWLYSLRTQPAQGRIMYGVASPAMTEDNLSSTPLAALIEAINNQSMIYWTNL